MNLAKMRRQRGRVRLTVRPADVALHPSSRLEWRAEVVSVDEWRAYAKCAHCQRRQPCPTEVYLRQQDGQARQRETV